jgi:hypothetical protein
MTFKTEDYMLPAHWACYLINGDATSFSLNDDGDAELAVIDQIIENIDAGGPVSCSDDPVFMKYHDARPYGVLAADCLMFTFLRKV